MEYTIKNGSRFGQAFAAKGGLKIIKAGTIDTIEMRSEIPSAKLASLKAMGVEVRTKARAADQDASAETSDTGDDEGLEALRAEYLALKGEEPDRRWKAPRLLSEVDKLKG